MKYFITYLVFVIISGSAFSQTDTTSIRDSILMTGQIHLDYKYTEDSIVIRWGYDHPQLWYQHISHPVTLWRRDVTNDGEYQKLGEFMPWDSSRIERAAAASSNPDMMIVVLENIHRHWENTLFQDYGSILERNDNFYNRWSLVHLAADHNANAANVAGLRYVDKDTKPKTTYTYKIVTWDGSLSDYKVAFPVKKNFQPVLFEIIEGDSMVTLTWEKKLHDYHFTSYWIEQSTDGVHFSRINNAPFVQMTDESIKTKQRFYSYPIQTENYKRKYYRIIGLDAFGDMSNGSEPVAANGRDRTGPDAPVMWADTNMMHHSKMLYWTQTNPADVKTYHLERNFGNQSSTFKNWATSTAISGKDTTNIEGMYRYRLIAVDTAGNETFSVPVYSKVYDLIPPSVPSMPKAIADTTGIVMITWDEHPDEDIIGYNIYAADGKSRHFTKLNQHIYRSRVFADSINVYMLNDKRYYHVVAVDNDYMISEPSPAVVIDRPDVIPPSPALIGDYKVLQEGIRLTILPSSSRDVVRHEIRRKEENGMWSIVASLTTIPGSYLDTTVNANRTYAYRVIAIDQSGQESSVVKDIVITSMNVGITAPEITYALDGNVVSLTVHTVTDTSNQYQLYRAVDDGKLLRYNMMTNNSFHEKLIPAKSYKYRVRMVASDGRQSPFSNEVQVQMQTQ